LTVQMKNKRKQPLDLPPPRFLVAFVRTIHENLVPGTPQTSKSKDTQVHYIK
jgi:hypothetical protein